MEHFLQQLQTIPEAAELIRRVDGGGCPAAVSGLQPVQRACVGAAVARGTGRPAVFVCGDEREARQLTADLAALTAQAPVLLLSREWQFRPGAVSSRDWERSRLAALYALANGDAAVTVATADALMARTLPPELLLSLSMTLEAGGQADLKQLTGRLLAAGYTRCDQVEGVGQFALRGGILDVFSPLMDQPVRCEFFDDEIDSMGTFDPATQRRTANVTSALLLPAAEVLPRSAEGGLEGLGETLLRLADKLAKKQKTETTVARLREDGERLKNGAVPGGMDRYLAAVYPKVTAGVHYLPGDAVVFLCESGRVDERVKNALLQNKQDTEALLEAGLLAGDYAKLLLSGEELYAALEDFPVIMADSLPTSRHPLKPRGLLTMNARQLSSYGGSLETAVTDLEHYRANGSAVLVLCAGESRAHNLHRLLEERGIPAAVDLKNAAMPKAGEVRISLGALSAGCEWPYLKLAVLTEGQLTAPTQKRLKLKKESNRQKIQSYTDLSPGDLVVHVHHGVGRFAGIQRMPVDGVEKDYIKIDYAGGDCLYVPVTQLDLVSKYIGGGEDQERQKLNKLGGTEWARQKTKAKKAAKDLAKGLTQLYAERQRRPGFAFSPDSPWQREFEDAFPYAETDDQLRAIEEIKKDMEKPRPMDRLLCGDVGYGKTEVALRAVMKCVLDGKQAAILVPTTVLAQQHYATACGRFKDFPVKIEVLSRFTTAKEQKRILDAAKRGAVDLLIGTHKLLQKNVEFKDLGLLIIDEEQRFGVTHKERLKEMSRQVDVLTLSATPIPRTLNMALSGLRDMSTIEEPPADRQPVQTYVLEHDWAILEDAMRKELARGGQVYYLHNRVESIDLTASRIQKMLGPEVRIVTGHGKMGEQELSSVMQAMVDGEADVLVCTTIIETGIDIPNVNTLIIEDADKMGLAQLHQIRGRIGRSARRAYAYLTYRRGKILQETAAKRLSAIREYVEFGSGFKIAMRDLEIRGAGNLLGPEQSGYLMSVGYDLYLKLLEEAVLEERGEEKQIETECSADLTVNANIPERYVPSAEQRMDLYRRIAAIRTDDDASDLLDEMLDRYGEAPKSVLALLDVALLRAAAAKAGISDISQKKDVLKFTLGIFRPEALVSVCNLAKYKYRLTLAAGETPALSLKLKPGANVLETATELVEDLKLASQG
ncbi:transcription-repair coupling factor [Oscillibacter valericigenes]|uniref:transcription-repair coupling factor n=1 Tax=Oscillibacter valericigenes TaxID=351091 RepID=UPI001F3ABFF0|nr:transcription-repair coupling factor [Oscillibacter valericigenes]MCF2617049.1 transcription-repair coupling factor [Oscillibacter valericigenes]